MQTLETRTLNQLSEIQPRLQEIHATLHETRSLMKPQVENTNHTTGPTFQIQTSIYGESKCDRLCMCQCHQNYKFKSPDWVRDVVGTLLLGYHGTQFWYRQPCNERLCQREQTCLLDVVYFFPTWFLRRVVFLKNIWTPTHGNVISIRTPRVVENANQPIFLYSGYGNVEGMRNLFAQGLASPFDVAGDTSRSPLYVS